MLGAFCGEMLLAIAPRRAEGNLAQVRDVSRVRRAYDGLDGMMLSLFSTQGTLIQRSHMPSNSRQRRSTIISHAPHPPFSIAPDCQPVRSAARWTLPWLTLAQSVSAVHHHTAQEVNPWKWWWCWRPGIGMEDATFRPKIIINSLEDETNGAVDCWICSRTTCEQPQPNARRRRPGAESENKIGEKSTLSNGMRKGAFHSNSCSSLLLSCSSR